MSIQTIIFLILGLLVFVLAVLSAFLVWYSYQVNKKFDTLLENGKIIQQGMTHELMRQPNAVEVIKLLHFPPANEVTDFANHSGPYRVFVSPQHTFAVSPEGAEGEMRVNYLRDRWVAGEIYSEWKSMVTDNIFWTQKPAEKLGIAILKWECNMEMRVNH